jgi:hypothetical protein
VLLLTTSLLCACVGDAGSTSEADDPVAVAASLLGAREISSRDGRGRWFELGAIDVAPPSTPAPVQEAVPRGSEEVVPYVEEEWFVVDDLVARRRELVHYARSLSASEVPSDVVDTRGANSALV